MAYVADLHIHSKYAGACSPQLSIRNLSIWAKYKGIQLLGTGDALHPLYQQELRRDLKDIGGGIYEHNEVKFITSAEVACIYPEGEVYRKIHILLIFQSLDQALKLTEKLKGKGANLLEDGRPILTISLKALCEIVFSIDPSILVIPAHIWTPWFGLYGSKSGYDRMNDCFGEFRDKIYAVETGLSSEPAMNWRVEELDNLSIVSFSDLHSLPRLGREATIFGGNINFTDLTNDLKNQNIIGSIEFFPEEGKYHLSGHRKCGVVYGPEELKQKGDICPVCKRRLTVGVVERVEQLATRTEMDLELFRDNGVFKSKTFPDRPGFRMLVQLEEILAEALGVGVKSQKVQNEYEKLVTTVDCELKILTKTPIDLLNLVAGERVAEGIERVREGKLVIEPGFDNTYGKVKIWED